MLIFTSNQINTHSDNLSRAPLEKQKALPPGNARWKIFSLDYFFTNRISLCWRCAHPRFSKKQFGRFPDRSKSNYTPNLAEKAPPQ